MMDYFRASFLQHIYANAFPLPLGFQKILRCWFEWRFAMTGLITYFNLAVAGEVVVSL